MSILLDIKHVPLDKKHPLGREYYRPLDTDNPHQVALFQHLTLNGSKSFEPNYLHTFLTLAEAHGWKIRLFMVPEMPAREIKISLELFNQLTVHDDSNTDSEGD